jgi:neutral ceramidase
LTLPAVIQVLKNLLVASHGASGVYGKAPAPTLVPKWQNRNRSSVDDVPEGSRFGALLRDARSSYRSGEWLTVAFQGANPSNDLRESRRFLSIERWNGGDWISLSSEEDPFTWIAWEKIAASPRQSCASCFQAKITWRIPEDISAGNYRIVFTGIHRDRGGSVGRFEGKSRVFKIDAR